MHSVTSNFQTVGGHGKSMPAGLNYLLATAACVILAGIYYAQPIIADIAAGIGIEPSASGIIITMAQVGYCAGVLFLVPLGDLVENRRLISMLVCGDVLALLAVGLSGGAVPFLASMFFVGFFSSVVQIIIPLGAVLSSPNERGRVLGLIISGAILGIVLARPAASWLTGVYGWRVIYLGSAGLVFVSGFLLLRRLPSTGASAGRVNYPAMLRSMAKLLVSTRGLRSRLLLMTFVFTGFTIFWATAPIMLQDELQLSHTDIALFSLVSLASPLCVLMAGRMVDGGRGFGMTFISLSMIALAFLATPVLGVSAALFAVAVFLLDSGTHMTNMVIQQSILSMIPEARSRLNSLCISFAFIGGAMGSSFGPWLYSRLGWTAVTLAGLAVVSVAFALNIYVKQRKI